MLMFSYDLVSKKTPFSESFLDFLTSNLDLFSMRTFFIINMPLEL